MNKFLDSGTRNTQYAIRTIFIVALLFVALTACRSAVDLEAPPDIRYGEDVCDLCGMIISEARFAAGYITAEGETRRFDDIGNMVVYHLEMDEDVAVFWVHDYETAEWLRTDEATLAYVEGLITPMGSGLVAFADRDAAVQAVASGGDLMDFPALLAEAKSGNVANGWFHKHGDPNHSHGHGHNH
jgi:copper chaperone NosL